MTFQLLFIMVLFTISVNCFDLNSTYIFEAHGIMLKQKGVVTFASDNMISIFRKAKLLQIGDITNCNKDWINSFNTQIIVTTNEHINLFNKISRPVNQNKRSLAILGIGLGALDLLLSGISYGKLSSHINQLEGKFNDFVDFQHNFDQNSIEFDKKIVSIIQASNNKITTKFQDIQCQIIDTTGELLAYQFHEQWRKTLDSFFKPVNEGGIKTPLTPKILTPTDLLYNLIITLQLLFSSSFQTYFSNSNISK